MWHIVNFSKEIYITLIIGPIVLFNSLYLFTWSSIRAIYQVSKWKRLPPKNITLFIYFYFSKSIQLYRGEKPLRSLPISITQSCIIIFLNVTTFNNLGKMYVIKLQAYSILKYLKYYTTFDFSAWHINCVQLTTLRIIITISDNYLIFKVIKLKALTIAFDFQNWSD